MSDTPNMPNTPATIMLGEITPIHFDVWERGGQISRRARPVADRVATYMLRTLKDEVAYVVLITATDMGGVEFTLTRGGARASIEVFGTGALAFVSHSRGNPPEHWCQVEGGHVQATSRLLDAVGLGVEGYKSGCYPASDLHSPAE